MGECGGGGGGGGGYGQQGRGGGRGGGYGVTESYLALVVGAGEGLPFSCSADRLADAAGLRTRTFRISLEDLVKHTLPFIKELFHMHYLRIK